MKTIEKIRYKFIANLLFSFITGMALIRFLYYAFSTPLYIWTYQEITNPDIKNIQYGLWFKGLLCCLFCLLFFWYALRLLTESIYKKIEPKLRRWIASDLINVVKRLEIGIAIGVKLDPTIKKDFDETTYMYSWTMGLITLIHFLCCIMIIFSQYVIVFVPILVLVMFLIFIPPFLSALQKEANEITIQE